MAAPDPPQVFHLLSPSGPGFKALHSSNLEGLTAAAVVRKELEAGACLNPDLFRAVSISGDESLQRELAQRCGAALLGDADRLPAAVKECRRTLRADLDYGIPAVLAGDCNDRVIELCLAARSSPCRREAFAYALEQPYACREKSWARTFANAEQLLQLEARCRSCFR